MRIPLSWLTELVPALHGVSTADVAARLTRAGFEVEGIEVVGADVTGVVVGRVLAFETEQHKNKSIRWCQVDVGEAEPRGIVCGAGNFAVGDKVAAAIPGAVLPGPFPIAARKTYGHVSDGMLCSGRELGLPHFSDHDGILILPADAPIGADATGVLGIKAETILDLAITPDRGYALSLRGIGREIAIALETPFTDPAAIDTAALTSGHPVRIEDPTACDRYVARVVTGLSASSTPERMAELVELTGMRPVSLAVDVTNYVLMLLGQPLHAFDAAKIQGEIVVRRAAAGERLTTLDGVSRTLDPEDIVIADDSGPIALGGVMGGASTEVTSATTEVLIEAAHFDAIAVTRSARRHNLPSEASRRFERGVDPSLPPAAAELAVSLLVTHGGAVAASGGTDVSLGGPQQVISFPVDASARKAGRRYDRSVVVRRLREIGATVADDGGPVLEVAPPLWRPDLTGPAELTEEVIRLEGYETLPSLLPRAVPGRGLSAAQRSRRAVGRALAASGLVEVTILPFIGAPALEALGLEAGDQRLFTTRVANPLAEDNALMRTTLLPGLLQAGLRNVGRGNRDVAVYELGSVFLPGPEPLPPAPTLGTAGPPSAAELAALDAALPSQPLTVGVLLTGNRTLSSWNAVSRPVEWSDAVAAAQTVATALGVSLVVSAATRAPWHPGRCAALSYAGRLIGHAGELHPRVAREHGFIDRTMIAELDLSLLLELVGDAPVAAVPVSPYPPVSRDIALMVASGVPAAEVTGALRDGAGELLESIRLFDDYTGAQLGPDVRSLAYRLVFRAPDRTLTDEAANAARDAAVAAAGALGATLRT